jgi:hypothetical protein
MDDYRQTGRGEVIDETFEFHQLPSSGRSVISPTLGTPAF